MAKTAVRATNVLLSCASDGEVGGVQTSFRNLVRWLENNGRRLHLVYPAGLPGLRSTEQANAWGRIASYCPMPAVVRESIWLSIPLFVLYAPITFAHLLRLIRKHRIDVINAHFLSPYFIHFVIAARLLRVPLVISVHGSDVAQYAGLAWAHRIFCRLVVRGADRIVACSQSLATQTLRTFPEAAGKITCVHNGIDDTQQAERPEAPDVSQPFVLCVCRHVHVKGVDVLLKAFALINQQVPGVPLVLVGDGPLLSEHKRLAEQLQIAHQVVFRGEVPHTDVPRYYANSALFVLPSRSEGFSVTLLEAAYYTAPIICTNVGGSPELIASGLNGLLVEPDNPVAMAAQMLRILRNPDLARRLAEAARETVRSRFLWRNQIRTYIAVYERCRRGTGASAPSRVVLTTTSAERRVTNVLLTCASDAEVGGVQTLFRDLVHWLEHEGRHVHLVYPARLPGLRPLKRMNAWGREASYVGMPGLVRRNPLISISILIVYIPLTFFDLARLIRKEKIDVINGHFLAPYFIHLAIAARLLRVPLVISVLGSDVGSYARAGWMGRILYRHIVRSADRVVACSEALAKRTTAAFPDASGKTTWVYCAVDDSQHTETRHNEDVPQPYILCVCRHVHVKGVDVLLKAFACIQDEVPDISLVLVGDGPLLSAHKSLAAGLGISHRVVFRGEVAHADVPSFFSRCALFVLPSRSEGFSITLLEAAYHGRPIVCTRVGGSPELISHGNNGLLVSAEDSADLAAKMLMLLRDNEFASRLGAAAHETVRGHFLWKDRIQDYVDIYEGRTGPTLAKISTVLPINVEHDRVPASDPQAST